MIIKTIKKRKKRQMIPIVLLFPLMLVALSSRNTRKPNSPELGVSIFSIYMQLSSYINWRCPKCNKYPGQGVNPKY